MIAIYKITNRLNGKPYVGQTVQRVEKRFLQHLKDKTPLGDAMRDCKPENFTLEIIEMCETQAQAKERERFWIRVLNCKVPNGYNQNNGGGGGNRKPKTNEIYGVTTIKLGDWLKAYRARNNMIMQDLANACGFSKAYIGMLEKGINPTTGKPVSPTVQTLDKIARGTGQNIDSLLKCLDGDQPVTLTTSPNMLSDEQATVLKVYDELNSDGRRDFWHYIEFLKFKYTPNATAV